MEGRHGPEQAGRRSHAPLEQERHGRSAATGTVRPWTDRCPDRGETCASRSSRVSGSRDHSTQNHGRRLHRPRVRRKMSAEQRCSPAAEREGDPAPCRLLPDGGTPRLIRSADNRFLRAVLDRIENTPDRAFATVIGAEGRDPIDWATLGGLAAGFAALCAERRLAPGGTVLILAGPPRRNRRRGVSPDATPPPSPRRPPFGRHGPRPHRSRQIADPMRHRRPAQAGTFSGGSAAGEVARAASGGGRRPREPQAGEAASSPRVVCAGEAV